MAHYSEYEHKRIIKKSNANAKEYINKMYKDSPKNTSLFIVAQSVQ